MLKYINRSEAFDKICEYSKAAYRLATDDMENSPDLLNEVIFSDVFAVDTDDIAEALYSCKALDIVRCVECKHRFTHTCGMYYGTVNFTDFYLAHGDDFYCAYGERKEVGE